MRRSLSWVAPVLAAVLTGCTPGGDGTVPSAAGGPRYFGSVRPPRGNVLRFNNGAEPETIDPALVSGQSDGRLARALFEGLATCDPRTLEPRPGQAARWETSADGLTWTFHLRPGLVWSDDVPLTARDFVWSWLRVLRPATAARNASLLHAIAGAEDFNRGTAPDSSRVGLSAPDDTTLVVRLASPVPYLLQLAAYPTWLPVPRHAVERWGERWTRPGHLVSNGAFVLERWRQNDRFELARNPRYRDAARVRLDRVVAYSVDDLSTSSNLYQSGRLDWNTSGYVPSPFVPCLRGKADFRSAPFQAVYFYSMNVTRRPFDDVRVRRALNLAVDRDAIARDLLKGTRAPWGRLTPQGYPGYPAPPALGHDPARAREFLAQAGYPGGQGFPKISILFSTSEDHRRIAEAVQAMWTKELGIPVELRNMEWGSTLQATTTLQYDVARRSWIGDYLDPGTFLEIMRGGDGNNRTGWSDPRYDRLLLAARNESDPAERLSLLGEAESLLLADGPVIPIYHYSTVELVKPYVRGLWSNALDTHPLEDVWIDHAWRPGSRLAAERRHGPVAERMVPLLGHRAVQALRPPAPAPARPAASGPGAAAAASTPSTASHGPRRP
jgi:ABC-type oligopeptide transport system substrate-binding subunit